MAKKPPVPSEVEQDAPSDAPVSDAGGLLPVAPDAPPVASPEPADPPVDDPPVDDLIPHRVKAGTRYYGQPAGALVWLTPAQAHAWRDRFDREDEAAP